VINSSLEIEGNYTMDGASIFLSTTNLTIYGCATINNSTILVNQIDYQTNIVSVSGCLSINNSHVEVFGDPTCVPNLTYSQSTLIISFSGSCQNGTKNIINEFGIILGIFGAIFVLILIVVACTIIQQQKTRNYKLNELIISNVEHH